MQSNQEKNDQREVFLSLIAHELKTPLTSIQGFTQALERKTAAKLVHFVPNPLYTEEELKRQLENVETMLRQVQRLSRLIDDITEIATMKQEMDSFELHRVNIYEVIQNIVDRIYDARERSRIKTLQNCPGKMWILGDEGKLDQLFSNVLSNALKFSEPGSQVSITCAEDHESYTVEIEDNGMGIQEQDLPYVFELYYRGRALNNRKVSGLGIGLYLSRKIVEMHKGTIEINSTLGKGTAVTVRFPKK